MYLPGQAKFIVILKPPTGCPACVFKGGLTRPCWSTNYYFKHCFQLRETAKSQRLGASLSVGVLAMVGFPAVSVEKQKERTGMWSVPRDPFPGHLFLGC